MNTALAIIERALAEHTQTAVAISGGGDSLVLADLIYRHTDARPPWVYVDSQMDYPETADWLRDQASLYRARLVIARANRTPAEQWERTGWPFLGKVAAVKWRKGHPEADFRIDCTNCCRTLKIQPGRRLTRRLGATLQFTGQRGGEDGLHRGLRALKDGAQTYVDDDKLTVCNPLTGWTDMMVRRYTAQHGLARHPARDRGAETIGCVVCGGGSQYQNSCARILRRTWPERWRRWIVDQGAGAVIIALKYDVTLADARAAIGRAGGLERLAAERPWVFDFTRRGGPLQGYSR